MDGAVGLESHCLSRAASVNQGRCFWRGLPNVDSIPQKTEHIGALPFAVCFEVEPTADGLEPYLALAGSLRPELDCIPGFVSIERSRSTRTAGRLLSLSYWADEAAVTTWRSHRAHFEAQVIGRNELFADYRLRVAQVIRRWTEESVVTVPYSEAHNLQVERKERSLLGLLRIDGLNEAKQLAQRLTKGSLEFEIYESIVNPDRTFVVLNRVDEDDARTVEEHLMFAGTARERLRIRVFDTCQIQRDYGRFDRAQAPQYFPPILQPTR